MDEPECANEIREVMESHRIGTQLVEQLWPRMNCVMVYDVDRLSTSFELLRTYCGSRVHYLFAGISSPEGTFSAALNLDDPQTVLTPTVSSCHFTCGGKIKKKTVPSNISTNFSSFSRERLLLLLNYTKMRYADLYNWIILSIFAPVNDKCL